MGKTTYQNTVTVPNSGTDTVKDNTNIGGDIVTNFKALADIVHRGPGSDQEAGVIIGGYGCAESPPDAVSTNSDRQSANAGGYSFIKSMTIPAGATGSMAPLLCRIPSGGMGILTVHVIDPSYGASEQWTVTMNGYEGTQYPENPSALSLYYNIQFTMSSGEVHVENSTTGVVQVGIFGTILGEAATGSDDYSW